LSVVVVVVDVVDVVDVVVVVFNGSKSIFFEI